MIQNPNQSKLSNTKPFKAVLVILVLLGALTLIAAFQTEAAPNGSWIVTEASMIRSLLNPDECAEGEICKEFCTTNLVTGEPEGSGNFQCFPHY